MSGHHGRRSCATTESLTAEIRALRKGRGINVADLHRKLGPNLRELISAGGGDPHRNLLQAELKTLSAPLADDLRLAVTASLGLSADTRKMVYFRERIAWLAEQLGYGYRTALRRVDTAELLLADQIAQELTRRSRLDAVAEGWYVEELRAVLRLDGAAPEAHEHRRIVATRDGLTAISTSLDIPSGPDDPRPRLDAEVLYGGRLVRDEQPLRGRFHFAVQLPRPLRAGEKHEFGLVLRLPPDAPMRPHYVCTPELRCELFDVRVRFDVTRLPRWVRRVCGETVRTFEARHSDYERILPDDSGEVHLQFRDLTLYLGYGIQWQSQ